jgi:hypothetical protein
MLSPEEPALALFGSYENPMIGNMAKSLAELSGFPVVVRPASDNPAFTLLCAPLFIPHPRLSEVFFRLELKTWTLIMDTINSTT